VSVSLKSLRAKVIHFIGSLAGDDAACGQAYSNLKKNKNKAYPEVRKNCNT